MATPKQNTAFHRILAAKDASIKAALADLIGILGSEDRDAKRRAAAALASELTALSSIVAPRDMPTWCTPLLHQTKGYASDPSWHKRLLETLIALRTEVEEADLARLADDDGGGGDWDGVLTEFVAQLGLPALFDKLVAELEALLETGEIPDDALAAAIRRLVRILRRDRAAKYTKARLTVIAVQRFVVNYLDEKASPAVKAIKRTAEDMRRIVDDAEGFDINEEAYLPPPKSPKLIAATSTVQPSQMVGDLKPGAET